MASPLSTPDTLYVRDSEDEDDEYLLAPEEIPEHMSPQDSLGSNPLPEPPPLLALPAPTELNESAETLSFISGPHDPRSKNLPTSLELLQRGITGLPRSLSTGTTHVSDSLRGSSANPAQDYLHLALTPSQSPLKAAPGSKQQTNTTRNRPEQPEKPTNSGKSIYDFDLVDSDSDDDVQFLGVMDVKKHKRVSEKKTPKPAESKGNCSWGSNCEEEQTKGKKGREPAQKKRAQSAMVMLGADDSSGDEWRPGGKGLLDAAGKGKATRSNTGDGDLAPLLPKKMRKLQRTLNTMNGAIPSLDSFSQHLPAHSVRTQKADGHIPEDHEPQSPNLNAPSFIVDLTHDGLAFATQKKAEYNAMFSDPTSIATPQNRDLNAYLNFDTPTLESTFKDPPDIYPPAPPGHISYQNPAQYAEPIIEVPRSMQPENSDSPTATLAEVKNPKKRAKTDLGLGGTESDHSFGIVASEWRAVKGKARQNMGRSKTANAMEFVDGTQDNWEEEEFLPQPKQKKPPKKRKKSNKGGDVILAEEEATKPVLTKRKKKTSPIILDSDDDGTLDELSTQVGPVVLPPVVDRRQDAETDANNPHELQHQQIVKLKVNLDLAKSMPTLETKSEHGPTPLPNMTTEKNAIHIDAGEELAQTNLSYTKAPSQEKKAPKTRKRKSVGDDQEDDLHVDVASKASSGLSPPPKLDPMTGEAIEDSPKAKVASKKTTVKKETEARCRKKSKLNDEKEGAERESSFVQSKDPISGAENEITEQPKDSKPKAARKKSAKANEKPLVSAETAEDEEKKAGKAGKAEVRDTHEGRKEEGREDINEKEETLVPQIKHTPDRKTAEPSSKKVSESSGKRFSWQKNPYRVGLSRRANIEPLLRSVRK